MQAESYKKVSSAHKLWTIVAALVLMISLVVSYKLRDILQPDIGQRIAFNPDCDLRSEACSLDLPSGGKVSLSISPKTIPLLAPLTLEVEVDGDKAQSIEVDFIGLDMNMGYNRTGLQLQEAVGEKQFFSGGATLPVCVRSEMSWEARVLVKQEGDLIMAPFRFDTQ